MENRYYNIVLNKDVTCSIYNTDHIFPKGFVVYMKLSLEILTSYLLDLNKGSGISIKHHPKTKVKFNLEDVTIEMYMGEGEDIYPKVQCTHNCPVYHRVNNTYVFESQIPITVKLAEKYLKPYNDIFNDLTYSQLKEEFNLLVEEAEKYSEGYYSWTPQGKKDKDIIQQELNRKRK